MVVAILQRRPRQREYWQKEQAVLVYLSSDTRDIDVSFKAYRLMLWLGTENRVDGGSPSGRLFDMLTEIGS